MYQTGENRVSPKAARACPNSRRLDIWRTNWTWNYSAHHVHTTIICNIKSLTCTKLEKIEFAQKLPGHARILEGSISWEPIFFWTWNFQKCFLTLYSTFISFQQILMIFSRDIGQKPHFGPNLGPNLSQDIFFRKSSFVTLNRLLRANLIQKIRKIYWQEVWELLGRTDGLTELIT